MRKIKGVVQVGAEILRQKAKPVKELDSSLKKLIQKMKKILREADGIGLAAPQVGESKRVILVGTEDEEVAKKLGLPLRVLIHPQILRQAKEEEEAEEGCLSFMDPEIRAKVPRPIWIEVEALDERFRPVRFRAEGLLSRVICHEVDHLEGILFTDRADPRSIYEVKEEDEEGLKV